MTAAEARRLLGLGLDSDLVLDLDDGPIPLYPAEGSVLGEDIRPLDEPPLLDAAQLRAALALTVLGAGKAVDR